MLFLTINLGIAEVMPGMLEKYAARLKECDAK